MKYIDLIDLYLKQKSRVSAVIVFDSYVEANKNRQSVKEHLESKGYEIIDCDCLYSLRFRKDFKSSVLKFVSSETYSKEYANLNINFYVDETDKTKMSSFMTKTLERNII